MKLLSTAFILLLFTLGYLNTYSQDSAMRLNAHDSSAVRQTSHLKMTLHSAPGFTVQFSGDYNFGVYELAGNSNGDFSPEDFQEGQSFGVRHGLGAILTVKVPLHEKGNIRLNISAMYNIFDSKLDKLFTGQRNLSDYAKYNVFSGVIGIENNFTPSYKIKTYVGGGIVASVISGEANIIGEGEPGNLKIIPAFRLGVTVYSGLEYMLSDALGFNCGFRFTHANLWLKQTKVSNNPGEIYLDDQRVTPRVDYSGFKQFAWGSFFGGVNFYFGVSDKEYIFKKN